jgi:hypothetical protein
MRLQIEQRERKGIVILDLKGPRTLGLGYLGLRDRLAVLHASGKVNIIVNLQEVAETDSTGLGALVFEDELEAVDRFFPDRALKHSMCSSSEHQHGRGSNLESSGPSRLLK